MTALRTAAFGLPPRGATNLARLTLGLLIATAIVDAAYLVGLIVEGDGGSPLVDFGLSLAAQWVPVSVFWVMAARSAFRQPPIVLAAAAVTSSAIGDTYYSLAMDADGTLPFPSLADPGYLLFYPLMVAALVMIARHRLHGAGGLVLLETAVATLGASALLALILDPVIVLAISTNDLLEGAVAVAYPLFDVLLLAVIAGIASVPRLSIGRRWWAMVSGLTVFAAADIGYAYLEGAGTYVAGTPLDAAWAVGLGLLAWWVTGAPGDARQPATARRTTLRVPAFAVLAGLVVLVVGTQVTLSPLVVVLAASTVGLGVVPIVFRQAMLGRMLDAQEQIVQQLRELDREKTDLLTTVNHEFRTPLTSISGHVELLLDDPDDLPPAVVDSLRAIERNGARLESLIDETFAASRFEGGSVEFATAPVDIGRMVDDALRRVEPAAARHGVGLHAEPLDPALRLDGDATHLEHMLHKLLDNAVKFSACGNDAVLSVTAERDEIVFRVTDHGIGVPEHEIPRLFRRFFRASNARSAAIPGVGLGLWNARQIAHAHGGTISVESAVGTGSTFTVRMPASAPPSPRA